MRLKKSFGLATNILLHSKLRSWLTIIGIVIGIAAVVSIIAISQGAQKSVEDQLGKLGANVLTITPGASRARGFGGSFGGGENPFGASFSESSTTAKNLTIKDVQFLKTINNVDLVMGEVSGTGDMAYSSKTSSVRVTGVDSLVWKEITTETLLSGRFFAEGDTYSIVIGSNLAEKTFEGLIQLNSKVTIEGVSFRIVGIINGGNSVYMPIEQAREVLSDVGAEEFDSILVKIKDVNLASNTTTLITNKLMMHRGIINSKNIDFSVQNPSSIQESLQSTTQTLSIFLGAIAAISLLVGAIGIANSMFTSVLERTRDIGIMKAIGAKNRDILAVFMFNAGLIGFIGGIGGIILGIIGSGAIGYLTSSASSSSLAQGGLTRLFGTVSLSSGLLIGALSFSVLIGLISGLIPAYRASRLNPVEALRYE